MNVSYIFRESLTTLNYWITLQKRAHQWTVAQTCGSCRPFSAGRASLSLWDARACERRQDTPWTDFDTAADQDSVATHCQSIHGSSRQMPSSSVTTHDNQLNTEHGRYYGIQSSAVTSSHSFPFNSGKQLPFPDHVKMYLPTVSDVTNKKSSLHPIPCHHHLFVTCNHLFFIFLFAVNH